MTESPTIFLIDQDRDVRSAISIIADQMNTKWRAYGNAEQFLDDIGPRQIGCIVSEFRLMGISGHELQKRLKKQSIGMPVIFVTAYAEIPFTVRVMQAGALTVLQKPVSEQELWDVIRRGIAESIKVRRIDDKHKEIRKRLSRLSAKERQVLELVVDGKTNKTIAKRLDVSVRTVEARRQQVFHKTGTNSIAKLVRLIIQSETDGSPK